MPNSLSKIAPLGDRALIVDFGNEIAIDLNDRAIALADLLESDPFPGFIESAPAYASVSVFYDLVRVRREFPSYETAFDAVRAHVEQALERAGEGAAPRSRWVEIPVDFSSASAMDLEAIVEYSKLTASEVIEIFLSRSYRVYMLGFLPGFAYMGDVDERIAIPRRETPRLKVPKGSVGIAGKQTGVYPLESPGGWQIIGRTEIEMFTPDSPSPCLLRPGDEVRFVRD